MEPPANRDNKKIKREERKEPVEEKKGGPVMKGRGNMRKAQEALSILVTGEAKLEKFK
eukprot:CAMPEP_0170559292 /NCGR_PEP_ID=MMETSP0211-20121228/41687_1 /TAXON_ID=311385 /ORGANISM="Pseudokeronopsis sp., Strain OXSARD2" /LENGTH=57 /DNA_ID=CAMNT_0010872165 /DNA_START=119 /DNA_END=289 /DNA_ORIENTATION=-